MNRIACAFLVCMPVVFVHTACSEPTNSNSHPADPADGAGSTDGVAAKAYTYEVLRSFPHDAGAFTQGLAIDGDTLFESTGNYGQSTLRQVALQSGAVERIRRLSATIFGEGLALYEGKIIQLTWKSGVGFIYDRDSFELVRSVSYPGEGWGITYDGAQFIMSDGSSTLYFRDKVTFEETGRIVVRDGTGQVRNLNELEYVKGEIYANIWQEDRIARIDPETGRVTGWVDLEGLLESGGNNWADGTEDVLNGIAYDAEGDRLFVTGKWWPRLFQIRLVEGPGPLQ